MDFWIFGFLIFWIFNILVGFSESNSKLSNDIALVSRYGVETSGRCL